MALFLPSVVLRGFPAAAYIEYASPQILVRPCSTKKILISELDTNFAWAKSRPGKKKLFSVGIVCVCLRFSYFMAINVAFMALVT
jgi:hypothetical protein